MLKRLDAVLSAMSGEEEKVAQAAELGVAGSLGAGLYAGAAGGDGGDSPTLDGEVVLGSVDLQS